MSLTVSIETLGGSTVFGPQEVEMSLRIKDLKGLFEPDKHKKLLDKATFAPLEDEDCLPCSEPHVFLLVQWVAAPTEAMDDEENADPATEDMPSMQKRGWERNMAEMLQVGDTFGSAEEPESYKLDKLLGNGSQAQVFACSHRDGKQYAVKVFRKSTLVSKNDKKEAKIEETRGYINFKREVETLDGLRHQRIVRVLEVQETEMHFFLIMELGEEDLQQYIVREGSLKEPEARRVFQQLLEGISYMHSKGILHRDLKLENIMVDRVSRNPAGWNELDIKIGDFGLAKKTGACVAADSPSAACQWRAPMSNTDSGRSVGASKSLTVPVPPPPQMIRAITPVGTSHYMAPEVLDRRRLSREGTYDKEVDYFSLGVCLYIMLTSEFPNTGITSGMTEGELTKEVEASFLDTDAYRALPENVQTLIAGLLRVDAATRFSLEDCRANEWAHAQGLDPVPPIGFLERLPSVKEDMDGDQEDGAD